MRCAMAAQYTASQLEQTCSDAVCVNHMELCLRLRLNPLLNLFSRDAPGQVGVEV